MNNGSSSFSATEEQLADHAKMLGQQVFSSATWDIQRDVESAVRVLEAMAPVAADMFQVRKIGMEVVIPEAVESAYVAKHGAEGRKVIDMLRGNVNL